MKADDSKFINEANQENRTGGGRNNNFCVGFSNIWRENIHNTIKKLRDSN